MDSTQSIKTILLILFIFLFNVSDAQHDHEGHSHSHGEETTESVDMSDIPLPTSSESISDKYEVLLKFQPVEPGEELTMTLFLSDVNTNAPIDSASVVIQNVQVADQKFEIELEKKGIFHIHTIMGEEKLFDLDVTIQSSTGVDIIRLKQVDFTHHHASDSEAVHVHESHLLLYVLGAIIVLIIGLLIGKYMAKSGMRKHASILLLMLCFLPASQFRQASAHEGEHGPQEKEKNISSEFEVLKESQFLMNIRTKRIEQGQFSNSRKLYGTVIPSSNGQGLVIAPQAGRIENIRVKVGERVTKGQQLATLNRISNASDEVNYEAEKNRLEGEYEIAQKEYDRIKSLEEIASRKQLEEAQSRMEIAKANRELYKSGLAKTTLLKSPISGVIGAFHLSEGSGVNAEQVLFTITDIQEVFIEAQAYEKDLEVIESSNRFLVHCMEDNHSSSNVKLLSLGQEFNTSNQSQRVIFTADNTGNEFKIGEFVNVFAFSNESENTIALPNSAITELEGRPIVFVKNAAEQFELKYIAPGHDNGVETVIESGIDAGDRVVVEGAYQVKLIYMNK